jgi:lysozyme
VTQVTPRQKAGAGDHTSADTKRLAAIVALACTLAAPLTMKFEGERHVAYMDRLATKPTPTICFGETLNVKMGDTDTHAGCVARLTKRQAEFAWGMVRCTPNISERPYVFGAALDLSWNLGVPSYCRSTAAKHFQARRWPQGCQALSLFIKAGGKVRKGLVARRQEEVKLCLRG